MKRLAYAMISALLAFLGPSQLSAQQAEGEKPKPAARVLLPLPDLGDNQQDTDQDAQTNQADVGPVTGIQNPTLGRPLMRHSYWIPGIRYSNTMRSNSLSPTNNVGWNTTSYVSGDLSALEAWSHSSLSLNYSGGGFSSTDSFQGSGQYHQFAAAYQIDMQRWQALFVDQFSYLPESAFGFGGMSGLALAGITGTLAVPIPGLQQVFLPGQTILTATGPRYSNAGAAQLTYELSSRGSITVAGVQALLRFTNPGNIDNDTTILSAGYNYVVTPRDTLGFVYLFSAYRYPGDPQAFDDHVAQFVYGRKITGKLALRLAGGPEITTFRIPIDGSQRKVSAAGSASLVYALHRSSLEISYLHGISNGSGVFTGASTDYVNATWNHELARGWNGYLNFGYAKNQQILGTSPNFDSWLAGAGLSRPLGRSATVSLAYQAQLQNSDAALCQGPNCGTNYLQHQIFLSFQWRASPIVLR